VVATLFPDSNKKYLSTDLMAEEPQREGFFSPEVELLGVQAIGRVCTLCADPVPGVG
jgi:cysteine synthase A